MTYCFLTGESSKTIADFNAKYFADGWSLSGLTGAFNQSGFKCIGVFEQQFLIGYITYTITADVADIDDVVVAPRLRKNGLGYGLLERCLNDLTACGVDKAILEVRKSNSPAVNLYTKAGFTQISQRKKYYSDGEDALVFQKELK